MLLAQRKPVSDDSTAITRPSPCRRRRCASNEITNITTNTGPGWIIPGYDATGNMTSGPSAKDPTKRHWYVYDAWNRLVEVWEDDGDSVREITGGSPDDTLIARYEYDGLDRRVAKAIYSNGVLDHKLHNYYNENWQILEVRKETGGSESPHPLKQYVWHTTSGGYIDAPAIRYYDPDTDGLSIATQYFTHDANFNVTALTDDTGDVIERYDYTPYGKRIVLNPDFTTHVNLSGGYEQDLGFQGKMHDEVTGLIYYNARYLHPRLGRFITRDPIGYPDGMNAYAAYHVMHGGLDPTGLSLKATILSYLSDAARPGSFEIAVPLPGPAAAFCDVFGTLTIHDQDADCCIPFDVAIGVSCQAKQIFNRAINRLPGRAGRWAADKLRPYIDRIPDLASVQGGGMWSSRYCDGVDWGNSRLAILGSGTFGDGRRGGGHGGQPHGERFALGGVGEFAGGYDFGTDSWYGEFTFSAHFGINAYLDRGRRWGFSYTKDVELTCSLDGGCEWEW